MPNFQNLKENISFVKKICYTIGAVIVHKLSIKSFVFFHLTARGRSKLLCELGCANFKLSRKKESSAILCESSLTNALRYDFEGRVHIYLLFASQR